MKTKQQMEKVYNLWEMSEDEVSVILKPYYKLRKYILDNYINIHPKDLTIKRLQQLQRNLNRWKLKLDEEKDLDIYKFISDTLESIKEQIEFKKAENKETAETYDVHIFTNEYGAKIFDAWYESDFRKKADYDFIFWTLKNDGFLNEPITQTKFQEWLPDYNPEDPSLKIGRIEAESKVFFTRKKTNHYNKLKQIIKG